MTPKEKAEELVKKYTDMSIFKFAAKKCALISVDEILKNYYKNHFQTGKKIDYWIEVKKEIENLQS